MKIDKNYTASVLHGVSPFSALAPAEARALADSACIRKIPRGEMLFTESLPARRVYVFASGGIQLFKTEENGREVVIRTIQRPTLFAEVVLFGEARFPVSAMAVQDSRVIELPLPEIRRLLDKPAFRDAFLKHQMDKQVFLTKRLMHYMCNDVEDRFYRFIAEKYPEGGDARIDLPKKDLAAAIGTVPETLSRLLKRLEKEKRLVRQGRSLLILRKPPKPPK
jgi:CRP/FNR family transcriptional regulator